MTSMEGGKMMEQQKIEMERIRNKAYHQACFTKRHKSHYKLASELSILCGTKIGLVIFSPIGRPFSFGYPFVNAILDCNLAGNPNYGAGGGLGARAGAVWPRRG
ncbi:putative agamous-like MADS-box protein AGL62 [Cocos nucifera]|uniref:Putative agamous-like MADS-box protein AGL62 n=1 Tax=Cocos nucifera TaxID=13894 RepID=A0A8K0NBR7_COCNU|nr:putative agamous-like MADS-box protein AGL62 [Cocos nucifera]